MSDAVVISELGIGVPLFTLCPIIASYYSSDRSGFKALVRSVLDYLKSPIFFCIIAGIIVARFQVIVKTPIMQPFWEALRMIEGTLWVMACMILGLQLRFRSIRKIIPLFIVSVIIQLCIQPLLASIGADIMHVGFQDKQVLILINAMPSAVVGTVFTTRYQCDSETASELVFLNIMFSLIVITLIYYGLFH
jgi:predicted permease